jgi:hypothetical protein
MLTIIGGISRSGKSIAAAKFLQATHIPYIPLDSIVMGFTNGIPEYGVNDKQFPSEIAKGMWRFVRPMLENLIYVGKDFAVEGEAILPEHVKELAGRFPGKIKACFIGYCDAGVEQKVSEIKDHSYGKSDWLANEPDETIRRHVVDMIEYSKVIRDHCAEYRLRYFDTSRDFNRIIEEAVQYLVP